MHKHSLPKAGSGVCRYPPGYRLLGFALAAGVGISAGIVQLLAVLPSGSVALLPESFHALTDGVMFAPALFYAWRIYWGTKRRFNEFGYNRLADLMGMVMVVSGTLSIVWAVTSFGLGADLHPHAGLGSALFGLGANALQLALMLGCRQCRFHRLIISHLLADTASSILVCLDLGLELDRITGLPVDAIVGILIGAYLIKEGRRSGHTH